MILEGFSCSPAPLYSYRDEFDFERETHSCRYYGVAGGMEPIIEGFGVCISFSNS